MTQDGIDKMYMQRCLQLAIQGLGRTRPNPVVGGVIVKDDAVVAEGYHQEYGHYHAERNAILSCRHPERLGGSTLYVNLEPCCHQGLTPPCADLIVEKGIKRVVCCNDDPNPLVAGNGFRKLEEAGITVVRHVLEAEGRRLNRRFFTYMEQQRPYIILKWAETADGFMAPANDAPYWITNTLLRQLSHRWRTEEQAILVGSGTYLADHPQLTARLWKGNNPQPIVLDRSRRLTDVPSHWLHLSNPTVEDTVHELYQHHLQSVIVEGGRAILDAFLAVGLWDEIRLLRGTCRFGKGIEAPHPDLQPHHTERYDDNEVCYYYSTTQHV